MSFLVCCKRSLQQDYLSYLFPLADIEIKNWKSVIFCVALLNLVIHPSGDFPGDMPMAAMPPWSFLEWGQFDSCFFLQTSGPDRNGCECVQVWDVVIWCDLWFDFENSFFLFINGVNSITYWIFNATCWNSAWLIWWGISNGIPLNGRTSCWRQECETSSDMEQIHKLTSF